MRMLRKHTNGGFGGAAKSVAEHASAIARLEIELAALEVKKKVTALAVGIGLGVAAAILALLGLVFVFATITAALATFLATWLALLIVTLGRHSMARFFPGEKISSIHGTARPASGRTVVALYHPAAALHQQSLRTTLEEDFRKLPRFLQEARSRARQATEPTGPGEPPRQLPLF
jgi:hypothetical protein